MKKPEQGKCLLLINNLSGRAGNLDKLDIKRKLEAKYGTVDVAAIEDVDFDMAEACKGYEYLAVGGGDGTLNLAINYAKSKNANLIYIPCGTLNDSYQSLRYADRPESIDLGKVNGRYFSYVLAAGTFTPIGYNTNIKLKQIIKQWAYFLAVFAEYKPHYIKASICTEKARHNGEFTLIMVVNSRRVFGFPFNKLYKNNTGEAHLLLIASPKGLLPYRYIKLFLLFFRAFFIGFKQPVHSKNITFAPFNKCTLTLEEDTTFCMDGEQFILNGENHITILKNGIELNYL